MGPKRVSSSPFSTEKGLFKPIFYRKGPFQAHFLPKRAFSSPFSTEKGLFKSIFYRKGSFQAHFLPKRVFSSPFSTEKCKVSPIGATSRNKIIEFSIRLPKFV